MLALSTAGGILYAIWRYVIRPLWRVVCRAVGRIKSTLMAIVFAAEEFPELSKKVDSVVKELNPDSGGSMRDETRKMGEQIEHLTRQQGQQTSMLHSVMQSLPQISVWTDYHGEPISVTQGFTALTGLDIAAMRDGGWKRGIHDDDRERIEKAWEAAIAKRQIFAETYRAINIYTGRVTPVRVVASLVPDGAGWHANFEKFAENQQIPAAPIIDVLNEKRP